MATLTIQLPRHQTQTSFNLRRWNELLADARLTKFEGRIETDRHGHILMTPPPAPSHGSFQSEITGAHEVWVCSSSGAMTFKSRGGSRPMKASAILPSFPKRVELV
jgi:hypothetical protein